MSEATLTARKMRELITAQGPKDHSAVVLFTSGEMYFRDNIPASDICSLLEEALKEAKKRV